MKYVTLEILRSFQWLLSKKRGKRIIAIYKHSSFQFKLKIIHSQLRNWNNNGFCESNGYHYYYWHRNISVILYKKKWLGKKSLNERSTVSEQCYAVLFDAQKEFAIYITKQICNEGSIFNRMKHLWHLFLWHQHCNQPPMLPFQQTVQNYQSRENKRRQLIFL